MNMSTQTQEITKENEKNSPLTKHERKKIIMERIRNSKDTDFKVKKIELSNNDPVISTVNKLKSMFKS